MVNRFELVGPDAQSTGLLLSLKTMRSGRGTLFGYGQSLSLQVASPQNTVPSRVIEIDYPDLSKPPQHSVET